MKIRMLSLLLAAAHPLCAQPDRPAAAIVRTLTPVLVVDQVEPAAAFWRERPGFEQTMEVPHGDRLGFVALRQGAVEIMYQSRASVAADLPALAQGEHRTVLCIQVADLDAVERAMAGVEIVHPRRTTFYGMHELAVREPGANIVVFAQPVEDGQE